MQLNLRIIDSWVEDNASISTVSINGVTASIIIKPYTCSNDKEILIASVKEFIENPERYN